MQYGKPKGVTPSEWTTFVHQHLPITAEMGAVVTAVGGHQVELHCPLAPNLNHHGTAFGGSLASLATLAGWVLVSHELAENGLGDAPLVVQRSRVKYRAPIAEDFTVVARVSPDRFDAFVARYRRAGLAWTAVDVSIIAHGKMSVEFRGVYVAKRGYAAVPR